MYQFYYSENKPEEKSRYEHSVREEFRVKSVRPAMWEEHCLECAVPLCYENCANYLRRADGRCKLFYDGISVSPNKKGCCGQAARVRFRKWANLMTIVFPARMDYADYKKMTLKNQKLGNRLRSVVHSPLPEKLRWESIRSIEYIRRRNLRKMPEAASIPDAFLFHGYSFEKENFQLILEFYNGHNPVYKYSLTLQPGENMICLNSSQLMEECWKPGNLIKVYPENNREAEIEILWCDFVWGKVVQKEKPAEKVKCLVWDLDNTLWDGILIETEDPMSLQLRPGVLELIKSLDERGIIQSIASKNDYQAAWAVVEKLGIADYFLYPQIHWGAKSQSMEQIASLLNIGIDSLALIDDSVFERKQVSEEHPCVRCYAENEIPDMDSYDEFQVLVTEESKNRRAMYRAEEKRNVLKTDYKDTVSFLRKCHLTARVFVPETAEEILRCYELSSRTNQLNMSGKKYTQDEFKALLNASDQKSFAFSCEDDFGKYGIVGFGVYSVNDGVLNVNEFAMSCRVAGKYVESALFSELLRKENCQTGEMIIRKTKKNALLRRTVEDLGFVKGKENEEQICYGFSSNLQHKDVVSVLDEL